MAAEVEFARDPGGDNATGSGQSWNYEDAPALHTQSWEGFHSPSYEANQFPIDVLELTGWESSIQGCIPERIRINSKLILEGLRQICGTKFPKGDPVIMLRPYKALLLHESAIRDWATEPEANIEGSLETGEATSQTSRHLPKEYGSNKQGDVSEWNCLISLLDELSARASYLQSLECSSVLFSDLYLLYRVGDIVISRDYRQAYRVLKVQNESTIIPENQKIIVDECPIIVHCVLIDFDGEWLGPVLRKFIVQPWGLEKDMKSLAILPLEWAVTQHKIDRSNLRARGATFVKVAGVSPMHYTGRTLDSNTQVNGTVIIDFQEAFRYSERPEADGYTNREQEKKQWRLSLETDLTGARSFASDCDKREPRVLTSSSNGELILDDSYVDDVVNRNFIRSELTSSYSQSKKLSLALSPRRLSETGDLTDDEFIIMNHRVFGFIVDDLEWGKFSRPCATVVSILTSLEAELDISLAIPTEDVTGLEFNDLVIPNHVKEILKSLSSHHLKLKQCGPVEMTVVESVNDDQQDEGLVIFLHGPSGVGKKTTVDCIAKLAALPLLKISLEAILPWRDNQFESKLEQYFALAQRWNAIVIIDQADIILAGQIEYSSSGVDWHNSHMTILRRVMIRMLDSFNGLTFLIGNHKPVFKTTIVYSSSKEIFSRINAAFEYPAFDKAGTVKLFELHMRWVNDIFSKQHQTSAKPACLAIEEDILSFASAFYEQSLPQERWNCRDIRKAFRTALALAHADAEAGFLARSEDGPTSLEPLKITLKATHFEAVVRSSVKLLPVMPPPPPRISEPQVTQYSGAPLHPGAPPVAQMPPRRMPGPPQQMLPSSRSMQQRLPQRQQPHTQPASTVRFSKRDMFPPEYNRNLEEESEWEASDDEPSMRRSQAIFLASPLSLEAKPELLFEEWEAFKDARVRKGSECSAIVALKGEPLVSFNQEAQDNVWWSRWGDRNRLGPSKTTDDAKAAANHKERGPANSADSSPLPERIRIHSKYITAILEDIRGTKISKTSFVMVRPFRGLVCYDDNIRAKYEKLSLELETSNNNASGEEQAEQPQASEQIQSNESSEPVIVANDGPSSRHSHKTSSDHDYDTRSSSSRTSSSRDGEIVATASVIMLEHLKCLIEFLDMIKTRVKFLSSAKCTKMTFADMWFLYTPGQEVIDQDRRQAYRILSVNSSGHRTLPPWRAFRGGDGPNTDRRESRVVLDCVHIMFDGKMLGSRRRTFTITNFEGEQEVNTLPVLPLHMVSDPDSEVTDPDAAGHFRRKLIDRGRKFAEMIKSTPMHYNGPLLYPKEEVDSQVVVDTEQCFAHWCRNADFKRPAVELLVGKPIGEAIPSPPCEASCCAGDQIHKDADAEQKRNETYISTLIPDPQDPTKKPSIAISPRAVPDKMFKLDELSDEDLVIMSYTVHGFILRTRTWATMDVKYLIPLNSRASLSTTGGSDASVMGENALDQLVLPKGHKDVVKSLISQHFHDKASRRYVGEEKDLIRGKGKGLIILLHGAPGVGKTTTAEGVAQAFNRPLFQITSGDLGTTARELEDALEWHFFLANKWNCILLLDEADVFLSVRSPEDFQRNSLVAVFLRVLEYYAGVLFLTTNRIGDFDEAFSSRIHISLYYPPLTRNSTRKIFDLNLRSIQQRIEERGVEIRIDHQAILTWAVEYWRTHKQMRWNGRQIRNACQTALALAEYDAQNGAHSPHDSHNLRVEGQNDPDLPARPVQLTIGHLETVAKAYMQFMRYLHEIYGKDSERRAKAMGIRAREFSMRNWMKTWAENQESQPQDEEEEEEEEEEDSNEGPAHPTPRAGTTAQHIVDQAVKQNAQQSSTTGPGGVLDPGLSRQHPAIAAMGQIPVPPFFLPNMQGGGMNFTNPFGMASAVAQPQLPQPAVPYQQASEHQRQYLAHLAAYGMLPGPQQMPFSGFGVPTQAPGGSQSQAETQTLGTAQILPGGNKPGPG